MPQLQKCPNCAEGNHSEHFGNNPCGAPGCECPWRPGIGSWLWKHTIGALYHPK